MIAKKTAALDDAMAKLADAMRAPNGASADPERRRVAARLAELVRCDDARLAEFAKRHAPGCAVDAAAFRATRELVFGLGRLIDLQGKTAEAAELVTDVLRMFESRLPAVEKAAAEPPPSDDRATSGADEMEAPGEVGKGTPGFRVATAEELSVRDAFPLAAARSPFEAYARRNPPAYDSVPASEPYGGSIESGWSDEVDEPTQRPSPPEATLLSIEPDAESTLPFLAGKTAVIPPPVRRAVSHEAGGTISPGLYTVEEPLPFSQKPAAFDRSPSSQPLFEPPPPPRRLPIERLAVIYAQLEIGHDFQQILLRHGLSRALWRELDNVWRARLAAVPEDRTRLAVLVRAVKDKLAGR